MYHSMHTYGFKYNAHMNPQFGIWVYEHMYEKDLAFLLCAVFDLELHFMFHRRDETGTFFCWSHLSSVKMLKALYNNK